MDFFDLVTPYFCLKPSGSDETQPEIRPNLTLRHFQGGHMFYTWDESRQQWFGGNFLPGHDGMTSY